jgi:hypothetical protein
MKNYFLFVGLFVSGISFSQETCKAEITEPSDKHQLQAQFTCKPENFTFSIYDQKGMEIYHTDNPDFMWDRKNNEGKTVLDGMYIYILKCNFDEEAVKLTGKFNLTE